MTMTQSYIQQQEQLVGDFATLLFRIAQQQGHAQAFECGTVMVDFLRELVKDFDPHGNKNIDLTHNTTHHSV
jgi:hypothetical protein